MKRIACRLALAVFAITVLATGVGTLAAIPAAGADVEVESECLPQSECELLKEQLRPYRQQIRPLRKELRELRRRIRELPEGSPEREALRQERREIRREFHELRRESRPLRRQFREGCRRCR